jgi:hypothetical protein
VREKTHYFQSTAVAALATARHQLAWRFLLFQKDSALAQWFRTRTEGASGARKTKMIVALARKLLIALWRMVSKRCSDALL